jgi:hypothetical protein
MLRVRHATSLGPVKLYQNFTNAPEDWRLRFFAPRQAGRIRADSAARWVAGDNSLDR